MNTKGIGSTEGSPIIRIAALIVIFAGVIYAKTIIVPFLLALLCKLLQLGLTNKHLLDSGWRKRVIF